MAPGRGPAIRNYFGDACVWWGVWLVAADAWPGVLTVASPLLMTYSWYSLPVLACWNGT